MSQFQGFVIRPGLLVRLLGLVLTMIVVLMLGLPYYNVYQQHMEGKAVLARAEYSKQALVQEALAKKEAAKHLAEAEVSRAEGVAKANKIIGESLKGNTEYLHYLWIHNLEAGNSEVIYIPTEAGLPIFEAGGRFQADRKNPVRADSGSETAKSAN